jgi:hypothetical protein
MNTHITEEQRKSLADRVAVDAYGHLSRGAVDNVLEALQGGVEKTRIEIFGSLGSGAHPMTRAAVIEVLRGAGVLTSRKNRIDGRLREVFSLAHQA